MPKRTDIKKIAIIGAGPIIIGQACEFDYSGTQACKALRDEGYEVVLINSNPATIMTDPDTADRTYVEPVTKEYVTAVLRKERPDALLPTLGGQTALNVALQVAESGVLDELGIEMIGADREVIRRAEDRDLFRETMRKSGIDVPKSELARTREEAIAALDTVGLPCIIRPAYTLGGTGGGIAYNREEFERIAVGGIAASMVGEILIEESLYGWKEFEMEMMRDKNDNVVVVCSIENFDAMGVHTGDSITVAPVQTMTDREYQQMRDASITIIRAIGVETGGCNIQFGQSPTNGRLVAIEMNPRVSRSSALASKATGFPIAKIAAKLAVGYTLDELRNDITQKTAACFEPTIDYCVVKIPRFAFEKFPEGDATLSIQMKSVGEVMGIGRTFKEALQKSIRSMETGRFGLFKNDDTPETLDEIYRKVTVPTRDRLFQLATALRLGATVDKLYQMSSIDPWFLSQIDELVHEEMELEGKVLAEVSAEKMMQIKRHGFSDRRLGDILGCSEDTVRKFRIEKNIVPVRKMVDTCGAEFEALTPYYYTTFGEEDEVDDSGSNGTDTNADKQKSVLILGGGPNRIGQGIEFDYCCCHAAYAVRKFGYRAIMMNCNPETVSTDYDTSDTLYFEPLTLEDVLGVVDNENPIGVILQFGGQTPLNLSAGLEKAGVRILGTSVDAISMTEDRDQFGQMLQVLGLRQTSSTTATNREQAIEAAEQIGYPILMRPSFVLGGAKMEIVFDIDDLKSYWRNLLEYSRKADLTINAERPILIDRFLEDAIEIDVDAIADGETVVVAAVMEHIEEAGIHSGDSACSLPPRSLTPQLIRGLESATKSIALHLKVQGLINIQFAVKSNNIYILEVNPRASRTVPFVSKTLGEPLAGIATRIMLGEKLVNMPIRSWQNLKYVAVKESVFPWTRFPGVDTQLGPEMKSTGEVMGIAYDFGAAFAKGECGTGVPVALSGNVFVSVKDSDKPYIGEIAKHLNDLGFHLIASRGTGRVLESIGLPVQMIPKIIEGDRPNILDRMINGDIQWIINTPSGKHPHRDEITIRTTAMRLGIPLVTTIRGAKAFLEAVTYQRDEREVEVMALQEYLAQ
ncbi:MAG: carbamoyl-phosphate synthase large subunit [Planctomycetaceae bacterium]|jgi:carbamoyl-phosphate synthase large subunit|nr:carbamoyl-phosphate synthase large subunit [Planctomycetaceae bacterium]